MTNPIYEYGLEVGEAIAKHPKVFALGYTDARTYAEPMMEFVDESKALAYMAGQRFADVPR